MLPESLLNLMTRPIAKAWNIVLLLISAIHLQASQFPECPPNKLPLSIQGPTGPVEIIDLLFLQNRKDNLGELPIRNRGNETLNGVLIQIQLLDQEGNLPNLGFGQWRQQATAWPSTFRAAQAIDPLRVENRSRNECLETAVSAIRKLGLTQVLICCCLPARWPPSFPCRLALQDDEHNWYRVSAIVFRVPASQLMFRTANGRKFLACGMDWLTSEM